MFSETTGGDGARSLKTVLVAMQDDKVRARTKGRDSWTMKVVANKRKSVCRIPTYCHTIRQVLQHTDERAFAARVHKPSIIELRFQATGKSIRWAPCLTVSVIRIGEQRFQLREPHDLKENRIRSGDTKYTPCCSTKLTVSFRGKWSPQSQEKNFGN